MNGLAMALHAAGQSFAFCAQGYGAAAPACGPGSARVFSNGKMRRLAISVFLLFHILLIASWCIPSNGMGLSAIKNNIAPYLWRSGLFQSWEMFAPNPTHTNAFVTAEVILRDGQMRLWTFPQMQEVGYIERYAKERYRKFANERLFLKTNSMLWPDAARYIARLHADPLNPPRVVKLIHCWSLVSPPSAPGQPPPLDSWERHVFFTYTVDPGDLR